MAGVERVNGASEVQSASSTGSEQRVVQQEEEQTFNYGSEDDIGDKPSFSEKAKGALHKTAEKIREDEEKHPIRKWFGSGLSWLIKGADDVVNDGPVTQGAKQALHEAAEEIREEEKGHPVRKWLSPGLLWIIKGADKLVNN